MWPSVRSLETPSLKFFSDLNFFCRHQIKAKPVNEKILKNVSLGLKAPIEKRPKTCPQPFHLTEYHKVNFFENLDSYLIF